MNKNQDKINLLLEKLEIISKRQDDFSRVISSLSAEINRLKSSETQDSSQQQEIRESLFVQQTTIDVKSDQQTPTYYPSAQQQANQQPPTKIAIKPAQPKVIAPSKIQIDFEKFIGENLINKIGIAILIIGVGIGAKYSIDNDLISPLTRIVLGYLAGLGLLLFGIKLKKNYESYSAVLVSGAIAIMYFITYSAYSFYDLIPQVFAFLLMVVFTVFTVVAAINYNKQVIAHIGLVGAYAVPFLLSEGSGKVEILFSYMAIINIGILVLAFKKYWEPLYFASFGLTWLVYFSWYVANYETDKHFGLALLFLALFFAIFYATILAYKLLRKEKFEMADIILLVINSFIFYGIGFAILSSHQSANQLLGLFTLGNAIIHFVISTIIYKQKLADKNLLYLASGLVLVFITIAIPVQLDGNWVTLLWAGEAALLFWIGRTKNVPLYERISYPLMILAIISITHDWGETYNTYSLAYPETRVTPVFNINFLSSLLFISAFGFINFLNQSKAYSSALLSQKSSSKVISYALPTIFIFMVYFTFWIEIATYWNQLYADSSLTITSEELDYPDYYSNDDLLSFRNIWLINYSLLFVSILAFINFIKIKSRKLGLINLGLIAFTIVLFLTLGLYSISELRESYLQQTYSEYYKRGAFNLGIRYISYAFVALALITCFKYVRQEFLKKDFTVHFDFLLHATILWIATSELLNWIDISGSTNMLGISILWGMYSLLLIALGIWKKKKHLRIGAIALFGVTLMKLFLYDISNLGTIAKTVVFVCLGVLLLIISFLYNKYKHIITDETNP